MSRIYSRLVEPYIKTAMQDTRVVMITGPRQAGKTTLAKKLVSSKRRDSGTELSRGTYISLDDRTMQDAARSDPRGFLRQEYPMVIDEIQRVPELLLAIKENVDTDPTPGRFLLTGSTNVMTLPKVADSLAGRMETINLFPLAQTEIHDRKNTFLQDVFQGQVSQSSNYLTGDDLVSTILWGGYPEVLNRPPERRTAWYNAYVNDLINRDIKELANIEHLAQMQRLVRALSEYAGQQINYSELGRRLELTGVTTKKYTGFLEQLFILRNVNPWFSNKLNRLIRSPKLQFFDSGLLASVTGETFQKIRNNRTKFGAILESFVFSELLKLSSAHPYEFEFFYFRDKDGNEVDIIIEDKAGNIIGIEVKASATVKIGDLKGLQKLAAASGKKFVMGIVLYDHDQVVPFGDKMWAVPISTLL